MNEMMTCIVPFCLSRRRGRGEWICARHWAGTPKAARKAFADARRTFEQQESDEAWEAFRKAWQRVKDEAITSAGISG